MLFQRTNRTESNFLCKFMVLFCYRQFPAFFMLFSSHCVFFGQSRDPDFQLFIHYFRGPLPLGCDSAMAPFSKSLPWNFPQDIKTLHVLTQHFHNYKILLLPLGQDRVILWSLASMVVNANLTHYHTMRDFDALMIYSREKPCEKRKNSL